MADLNVDLTKFNKVYSLKSVVRLVTKTIIISVLLTSALWGIVLVSIGVHVS